MKLNIFLANETKLTVFFRFVYTEAATRGVLCKKVFLEISQNSQKTHVPESLF